MCVLSIKVPIRKKSGNLFNDPCTYIYISAGFFLPCRSGEKLISAGRGYSYLIL